MARYYEGITLKKSLGAELEESLAGIIACRFRALGDMDAVQYTGGPGSI